MATPHVAGAAALALAAQPAWSGADVKSALLDGVDRPPGLAGRSVTGGRLNAATAVGIAASSEVAAAPAPAPAAPRPRRPRRPPPRSLPPWRPRINRLQVRVRSRQRKATLTFQLAAEADVGLRLERKRCSRGRCNWRVAGTRSRHFPAGTKRWRVGLRLARGTWRATLVTPASTVQKRFKVR